MARFTCSVEAGGNTRHTYKTNSTSIDDSDIGKPVKMTATDVVGLCSDGDAIFGFIDAIEPSTADGYPLVTVVTAGRVWVILDGDSAVGTLVEAAANTAAGAAKAGDWGLVSTKAAVAADLAVDASGTLIAASVNALLAEALLPVKQWMVISGTGLDEATVLIEKQ